MERRRLLVWVSAGQLASSVLGMAVAIRRTYAFDVSFMRGHRDRIARESIFGGTAYSAPVITLVAQAAATAVMSSHSSAFARRTLFVIGVVDIPGYAFERMVRRRLTRAGWDPFESPLVLIEVSLAVAMTLLARRGMDEE